MTTNIFASLRKDRKDSRGLVPIYIYVYAGERLISKTSIGQKVDPGFWLNGERRVNKKHKNATLINALINKTISDLETKILEEKIVKGTVNLSALMTKEKYKNLDFFEFAEKQISEKNYADETRRNYRVNVEKVKSYRKNLKLSDIDYQFLQGYESHLRDVLKNEPNTVWGNFKFLNTLTNDALKMKFLAEDPFKTYQRPKYKQTLRSFLDQKELAKFEDFLRTTQDESLFKVCTYFLFMAYTGLRFSDAIRFRIADHVVDGERIVIETQKTKKVTNLFINKKIASVMPYVDDNRLGITQVDFNRKLKLICRF